MILYTGQELCVVVQLFPNIKYNKESQMEPVLFPDPAMAKWANGATALLLSSLLDLGISGQWRWAPQP